MNRFLLTSLRPHHTFATADGVSWLPWRWAVSFIGLGKRQQKTFCSELAPSSWMSHECLFSSDASRDLFFCALTKASELKSSNTNHPKKSPMIFFKAANPFKTVTCKYFGQKNSKKKSEVNEMYLLSYFHRVPILHLIFIFEFYWEFYETL